MRKVWCFLKQITESWDINHAMYFSKTQASGLSTSGGDSSSHLEEQRLYTQYKQRLRRKVSVTKELAMDVFRWCLLSFSRSVTAHYKHDQRQFKGRQELSVLDMIMYCMCSFQSHLLLTRI